MRKADAGTRRGKREANAIEHMQATAGAHVLGNVGNCDGADRARKSA